MVRSPDFGVKQSFIQADSAVASGATLHGSLGALSLEDKDPHWDGGRLQQDKVSSAPRM